VHVVPQLSAQCIINGLPKHAYEDEIRILTVEEGPSRGNQYYKSSTFLALSFITKRGISLYDSYPFAGDLPTWGYREDDRDFDWVSHIYFSDILLLNFIFCHFIKLCMHCRMPVFIGPSKFQSMYLIMRTRVKMYGCLN
jgi:hypothetical protein